MLSRIQASKEPLRGGTSPIIEPTIVSLNDEQVEAYDNQMRDNFDQYTRGDNSPQDLDMARGTMEFLLPSGQRQTTVFFGNSQKGVMTQNTGDPSDIDFRSLQLDLRANSATSTLVTGNQGHRTFTAQTLNKLAKQLELSSAISNR